MGFWLYFRIFKWIRPIRLQYIKETNEVSQFEEKYMGEQISNLSSFKTEFGGIVKFNMELTMIDRKVFMCLFLLSIFVNNIIKL